MNYNLDEMLVLVKELTDIYTSKESTSVTYEAAQQLMGAVLYCIRENEMVFDGNEQSGIIVANRRQALTAREAYDNGYRLVTEKIKKVHRIYNELITDFKGYGNRAYYETVIEGMPEFFKWYDPRLNPMNHIILIDYTVLEQLHMLEGVDLIYRWLSCVQLEQKFLGKFSENYVRDVLIGYHSDYEELLINVCSIVLNKVLLNMLIGVKPEKKKLEASDYESIRKIIMDIKKEELEARLLYLLEDLIMNIYQGDLELFRYLEVEVPNIASELKNATIHNILYPMLNCC